MFCVLFCRRLKCTIVITRTSVVNFSYFDFSEIGERNLTRSKISTSSTKFVFFGPIGKTKWSPWLLIGWDIFDFSETAKRNSTKLDRKIDRYVLYKVCVFRADQINKMAASVSDWLRHFQLLFWNRWTEFNETWQDARSQRPLPSLCFFRPMEKKTKMAALASDWMRHFYFSETAEWNSTKLQEAILQRPLPSLWGFFLGGGGGQSENQDDCPDLWLAETFSTSFWNRWMEFHETWLEARSQRPLPSLCFRADRKIKMAVDQTWGCKTNTTYHTYQWTTLEILKQNTLHTRHNGGPNLKV